MVITGSIRAARSAGIQHATTPIAAITTATLMSVTDSGRELDHFVAPTTTESGSGPSGGSKSNPKSGGFAQITAAATTRNT